MKKVVFNAIFVTGFGFGHNSYPDLTSKSLEQLSGHFSIKPEISAWKKLNSPPETTLLTYIHIPKTAGATFKNNFHSRVIRPKTTKFTKSFIKPQPYKNFFPPARLSSWSHPGCGRFAVDSGLHCGYSELSDCVKNRRGKFLSRFEGVSNVTNKFFTILRSPVERVISEFVWFNFPKHKTRGYFCPGPWSEKHCLDYSGTRDDAECGFLRGYDRLVNFRGMSKTEFDRLESFVLAEKTNNSAVIDNWMISNSKLCKQKIKFKAWLNSDFNSGNNRMSKSLGFNKNLKDSGKMDCTNFNGSRDNAVWGDYTKLNKNVGFLHETIRELDKQFAFVGILEKMEFSLMAAAYVLGYDYLSPTIEDKTAGASNGHSNAQ